MEEVIICGGFLESPGMQRLWYSLMVGITVSGAIALSTVWNPQQNRATSLPPIFTASLLELDPDEPFLIAQNPVAKLPTADEAVFQRVMKQAKTQKLAQRSVGEIVQAIADQFLGYPYQENLLDRPNQETLVTSLRKFDCVLFVETVLAIARGIKAEDYSTTTFKDRLQHQRYENGNVSYCDRLHYFSHWIEENQRQGVVTDLTSSLGGIPLGKTLNFMSENWKKYPKQVRDPASRKCIKAMETRWQNAKVMYIPTAQIYQQYGKLQAGDIIAIATDLPGLDVTHTGLVYRGTDGTVGLIHAAPGSGVKISSDLQTYAERVDHAIGILVARPQ
jgi:hypothetical protein